MAKDEGYIKLFRSLLNWEWIDKPETLSTFIFLLLVANHSDNEWHGITIKRGQTVTSYAEIAHKMGISLQQVRTSIKRLNSTGEITHQTTNRYSLITIRNYEVYQSVINTQTNNQATISQQPSNNQATTNKNDKNDKNDKKYIYEQKNAFFDSFWCAYPKKKNKLRAQEVFYRLNVTDDLLQKIITAINKQKLTEEWQKENGRFIPYPDTWLKYRRWEDETKVTTYQKEVSFDIELAERQAKENRIDFATKKNRRKRSCEISTT